MFKKLLSNLPFNPSLIGQVSFYAKRLHREASVRRMGLVFVVLAMGVQLVAVISPPQPTLAQSDNDMVRGGFSSREQAVNYCRSNTQGFAEVLDYYKITCDALAGAATRTVRSTDYSSQLDSLGRIPQGPTIPRTGKTTDEYPVMINGTEYHMRNLWAWDMGSTVSSYRMLEVINPDGTKIFVMFDCGNIVTIGKYVPPQPPPPPIEPPTDKCPQLPGVQNTTEECDVCPNVSGIQPKREQCDVCPNVPGEQLNKSECYPCPKAQTNNAVTACLELAKTASNQTQNLPDANGTMARASDVIVYTLSAKNTGSQTVKGFVVEENISDILEYADVTDLGGGQLDAKKNVLWWPKEDIAAGAALTKKITIKVKNPIPQTPVSTSSPTSFDLVMNNVYYGNVVNIKLPAGVGKSTEVLVQTMPNTGPGATLAIGFGITTLATYLFVRNRLLAQEMDIVRTDYVSTGGA